MATVDTDRDGKVSLAEFGRWMSTGRRAPEQPPGPWTPIAARTGAPVIAGRADHLPVAQISTDSTGWKEVLGGTAVARGRTRGNAALGRASRNLEVPLDGHSSPWRQKNAVNGSGERADNRARTPPRIPRSPSVTSSPDSLLAATAGVRNAGVHSPGADTRASVVHEAWSPWARTGQHEESDRGSELSESDLEEAGRLYESTNGLAAATGSADPPMSARDGWELCCRADGQEYWFNFQTGERREQTTTNDTEHSDSADEPVEEPRRYETFWMAFVSHSKRVDSVVGDTQTHARPRPCPCTRTHARAHTRRLSLCCVIREAPQPTVETAVSTVVTAKDRNLASLDRERSLDREIKESQWRREQRLRELQAMEEEHLRGEPTVLVLSYSVIHLPAARLTEEVRLV